MSALAGNFLMPAVSGAMVAVALLVLVMTVLWIVALVDALIIPESTWRQAEQSKLLWVLLVVLLGVLGSLLYVVMARPALSRARRAGASRAAPSAT